LQYGGNPDQVDNNGQTPLYYAVRGGKLETVEFLIQTGVNVNHEDKKQQTPMVIAKRSNKQQIINLLAANGAKGIEDLRKQHKINLKKQAASGA
jgi:ankyrin repeat protein